MLYNFLIINKFYKCCLIYQLMREKRDFIFLFVILMSISFYAVSGVLAADLNLKINGAINGYSSDVYIKSNSNALSALDAYDFEQKNNPDNYSVFYTNSSSVGMVIDTSNDTNRSVFLVYSISVNQTGTINFTWDKLDTTDYDGNLTYYGSDSTYTNSSANVSLRRNSSYSANITNTGNIYLGVRILYFTAICGDSYCEGAESCSSCSSDCGACPSTTGSSGAGGGSIGTGNIFWLKSLDYTNYSNETSALIVENIGSRERIMITSRQKLQFVGISELGADYAIINISSLKLQIRLGVGQGVKIDMDYDKRTYDLIVQLNSINGTKANIAIQEIDEEIAKEKEKEELQGCSTDPESGVTYCNSTIIQAPKKQEIASSRSMSVILSSGIIMCLLVIVILVFYVISLKKKRLKRLARR